MTIVIPDSITPVEGWKGWYLSDEGTLYSPNGSLTWKPGEKACAGCMSNRYYHTWEAKRERPYTAAAHGVPAFVGGFNTAVPAKPTVELPQGLYWHLVTKKWEHDSPIQDCTCGIYTTSDILIAANYGNVLGKVKGWGNVVQHANGWRVQHAYPSQFYVLSMEHALALADFGVPVSLAEDVKDDAIKTALRYVRRHHPQVTIGATGATGPAGLVGKRAMHRAHLVSMKIAMGMLLGVQVGLLITRPSFLVACTCMFVALMNVLVWSRWWP